MNAVVEKFLDWKLWHACAGSLVQIPAVNSEVFYFPQGHAEHTLTRVDFGALGRIPAMILSRVASVKYLADTETDEVYVKIVMVPIGNHEQGGFDDGDDHAVAAERNKKPTSFAKTLTQSDANNGGGFSVPRLCAETIFPSLDYNDDPPVQTITVKDVHGESWKFRHIYRGTPRRHLLTTGWSNFVNTKKLVAGDSIVFLRAENGDICVGIRRARRGSGISGESSSMWNSCSAGILDCNKLMHRSVSNSSSRDKGRVKPESVVEAAFLAVSGKPFEVVFYPRASMPEFVVKASSVMNAMKIQWSPRLRFKMAFETEDSSQISWFMGTVASVQFVDPLRWPNSPWRLLQVMWDEPALLQNVKYVNPWLVELVPNLPILHLPSFSPPRKKLRVSHHQDFQLDGGFPMPSFSGNPLGPSSSFSRLSDNISVGIQGARHAKGGVPSSDLHLSNKLQMGLLPANKHSSFQILPTRGQQLNPLAKIHDDTTSVMDKDENVSCLLSMSNSSQKPEKVCGAKTPQFILFGQPILTEQQMCHDHLSDAVCRAALEQTSSVRKPWENENSARLQNLPRSLSTAQYFCKEGHHAAELGLDIGHCKIFLGSEDVGTLDLSGLGSYEALYRKLDQLFGTERLEMLSHLVYRDVTGALKQAGEEPFSEFIKFARRLTILMKPDNAERTSLTGLPTANRGLNSSNQAGPQSVFA